jgi:hypothetical protein
MMFRRIAICLVLAMFTIGAASCCHHCKKADGCEKKAEPAAGGCPKSVQK